MTMNTKIALVGMACRFPESIYGIEKYWESLINERHLCGKNPHNPWNSDRLFSRDRSFIGKPYVQRGHIMGWNYEWFDADFFGIASGEAECIDPQQRLLLELTWEALENAGLDASEIAGSDVGVYIGGFRLDHLVNQVGARARGHIGTYSTLGSTLTMLANRISYAFDFRGPSFALDTACSSSLVAFAYACHDLASGRCSLALTGGVNLILRPKYSIAMAKGNLLAPDGRSKSYDARAGGYGPGEGAGVVLLKRLAAALEDGDEIMAVVEAAGVNQDGRTSGITTPDGASQEALMRRTLAISGVRPQEVAYVEAHGTGTPVGDAVEAAAIARVYGANRDRPCVIGSVKSNIGHLEAAAGVAGIIKAVLMIRHNRIPPLAIFKVANPALPLDESGVALAIRSSELSSKKTSRCIAINSFGYGGTNAHAVLSHPGRVVDTAAPARRRAPVRAEARADGWLLPISARHPDALRELAAGYRERLLDQRIKLADFLYSATRRRTHLSHRLAVWGRSRDEIVAGLEGYLETGVPLEGALGVQPVRSERRCVLVYTGMGPEWWAMGQELHRSNPSYRRAVERADTIFRDIAGFSVLEEMLKGEGTSRLIEMEFAQPATLFLQIGLTEVLQAHGVVPGAVVGHGVGEVASACASGMLSLEDALRVSFHRSRVQKEAAGTGGMIEVGLSEGEALELLASDEARVSVAAVNSPKSVTLAGDDRRLDEMARQLDARGVLARRLAVEIPYHSPMMEPLKAGLRKSLAGLKPCTPQMPLYSTVTGARVDGLPYDAAYWCENIRRPVQFSGAIKALLNDGFMSFVEVGPHPVLRRALAEIFAAAVSEARSIRTLQRGEPEARNLRRATAEIYALGCDLDWSRIHPHGRFIQLPNYPWQGQHVWRESGYQRLDRLCSSTAPLLGINLPGTCSWRADLADHRLSYLFDHTIDGVVMMPAAGYIEALLSAQQRSSAAERVGWCLRDIRIERPLIIASENPPQLDIRVSSEGDTVEVWSVRDHGPGQATRHALARLHPLPGVERHRCEVYEYWKRLPEQVDIDRLYEKFAVLSLQYGPMFRPITELRRDRLGGQVLARLELPKSVAGGVDGYIAHPILLDACFQTIVSLATNEEGAYLPTGIRSIEVHRPLPAALWCWGRLGHKDEREIDCDLCLFDRHGDIVARIRGLTCSSLTGGRAKIERAVGDYAYAWHRQPFLSSPVQLTRWLVVAEEADHGAVALESALKARGVDVQPLRLSASLESLGQRMREASDIAGIAVLSSLARVGVDGEDVKSSSLDPAGERATAGLLAVVRELAACPDGKTPRLYVLTRGAFAVRGSGSTVVPREGTLVDLARLGVNEFEALRCTTIDLPLVMDEEEMFARLADELVANAEEDEIALRHDGRYVAELTETRVVLRDERRAVRVSSERKLTIHSEDGSSVLAASLRTPRLRMGDLDVLVEHAGGDAVAVARTLAGDASDGIVFGVVGRIARIGGGVTEFQPNDKICALAPLTLDTAVVVDATRWPVAKLPDEAVSASAASLPLRAIARRMVDLAALETGSRALVCRTALGCLLADELRLQGLKVAGFAGEPEQWTLAELTYLRRDGGDFAAIAAPLLEWERTFGAEALAEGACLIDLAPKHQPFRCHPSVGRVVRLNPSAKVNRLALRRSLIQLIEERPWTAGDGSRPVRLDELNGSGLPHTPPDMLLVLDHRAAGELQKVGISAPSIRGDCT